MPRLAPSACACAVALAAIVAAASGATADPAPDAAALSADAVVARWHGRLDGRHFSAVVRLAVERGGRRESRRIRVWRDDAEGARERLLVRFEEPPDLRGLGLLYLENPGRQGDYFLWQPALRRVRRLSETLAREDVYGVDLEYLGFGVTPLEPTEVLEVAPDSVDGAPALRVRERARPGSPRFDERVVWLDATRFVPLRAEHHRGRRTVLVARTRSLRDVQGVATPAAIEFERAGETVTMTVEEIDYAAPIPEAFFSTLALVK